MDQLHNFKSTGPNDSTSRESKRDDSFLTLMENELRQTTIPLVDRQLSRSHHFGCQIL